MSTPTVIINESNRVAVRTQDGTELYYSYRTLVGVVKNGKMFRTNVRYSVTTSKHLNKFGFGGAEQVDQNVLEAMA